jgi:hypothetical protein
VEKK